MAEFIYRTEDIEGTDRLGQALAELVPDGTAIALIGTLGAGKTRLVQAVAAALKIPPQEVTSPTFVLCQEYHGARSIYHFDAYRIGDKDEFFQLGPEEYFDSPGIVLVEWADRVESCLPAQHIEIVVDVVGETARRFTIRAMGEKYKPTLRALEGRLAPRVR